MRSIDDDEGEYTFYTVYCSPTVGGWLTYFNSPSQVQFRNLLRHASHGSLTREEWELLNSRFENNLPPHDCVAFQDCVSLYTTRSDVHDVNVVKLHELNQPCARVTARHDGGHAAARAPADEAGGLETHTLLAKGAKVMITRNIWQTEGALSYAFPHSSLFRHTELVFLHCLGLVNGAAGLIEDVVWPPGSSRSELPLAVLV
jgi:hypothetical protein